LKLWQNGFNGVVNDERWNPANDGLYLVIGETVGFEKGYNGIGFVRGFETKSFGCFESVLWR